jgi:hypothetical protein
VFIRAGRLKNMNLKTKTRRWHKGTAARFDLIDRGD